MEPFLGSLVFYAFSIVLCEFVGQRQIVRKIPAEYRKYAVEFFATLLVCLCVFENGVSLVFYGYFAFMAVLTVLVVIVQLTDRGAVSNPAVIMHGMITGKLDVMTGNMLIGIAIEAGLTVAIEVGLKIIEKRVSCSNARLVANGALIATVVVMGINMTGAYLNPVLATTATYGCEGMQGLEHAAVYWLGPLLGLLATDRVQSFM